MIRYSVGTVNPSISKSQILVEIIERINIQPEVKSLYLQFVKTVHKKTFF